MLFGDVAKSLTGFRRVNREEFDTNGSIEVENRDDVAIIDLDDASKQSGCCYAGRQKRNESESQDDTARHTSPREWWF